MNQSNHYLLRLSSTGHKGYIRRSNLSGSKSLLVTKLSMCLLPRVINTISVIFTFIH